MVGAGVGRRRVNAKRELWGVIKIFYILTVVVIQLYAIVKMHPIVYG